MRSFNIQDATNEWQKKICNKTKTQKLNDESTVGTSSGGGHLVSTVRFYDSSFVTDNFMSHWSTIQKIIYKNDIKKNDKK